MAVLTSLALPAAAGLLLSLALERLLVPPPGRRPGAAWCLHIGLWLCLFAFEMALFRRPFNAAANVLALQLFVILVSNAKYASLREPFIYQDFEYFSDAIRHPRLYLPFFGLWRAILAVAALLGALYGGVILEEAVWTPAAPLSMAAAIGAPLFLGALFLVLGNGARLPLTLDPARDLAAYGLFPCLWRYWQVERLPIAVDTLPRPLAAAPRSGTALPDIVAIQSESFFDARRLSPLIRPDLLPELDRLQAEGLAAGRLAVPAWGANTVRSEFAFLSGLGEDAIGIHRFNPYRRIARLGLPTLASTLKALGYRTVCLHPYPASFYYRHIVMPRLGFDQFIDIRGFGDAERFGPYISDRAVAEKVKSLAAGQGQPVFVFVITMENHGPLHWEKVAAGDAERLYGGEPPAGWEDLTVYLRHLANADRMLGELRRHLEASPREALLAFYGDHVPIMPAVYAGLPEAPADTDYLIWRNRGGDGPAPAAGRLKVEELAARLLHFL